MKPLFFLPQRCLRCGQSSAESLCQACEARLLPPPGALAGPALCRVCGQVRLAEADRCMDCGVQEWSFPRLEGLVGYQEPGAEALRLYKFGGQSSLARSWVPLARFRLDPLGPLVPVPPSGRSLVRRGWDPVATFVRALGRGTGVPVWSALRRRGATVQKSLNRTGRFSNAAQSYALNPGVATQLAGCPILWLVDDVVTTGATVEACAQLLRAAGVREVRVLGIGVH